jgi:exosortase C (VPDSG-CTERM-specific)
MSKSLVENKTRASSIADRVGPQVGENEFSKRGLVYFGAFTAILIIAFVKPMVSMALYAAHHALHSHILLVPFVSAYLIYLRRHELPRKYSSSPGWAGAVLVGGVAALAAALTWGTGSLSQNDYLALMTLSFLSFLAAGGFLFLGREWMRTAAFPFAFLIFMVPMPDGMADALETASKVASAEVASWFFSISGTPFLRDGQRFQLPDILIEVTQECSGIRSSWVLFITSVLAANMFLKSSGRRAILVCFVIPLGIIRNGFRVFVIGMLCVDIGPDMIHSVIHYRGGPIFFVISLIPLFGLLWWLRRSEVRTQSETMAGDPKA